MRRLQINLGDKVKVNSRAALPRLGRDKKNSRFHPYPSQVLDLKGKEGRYDGIVYPYLSHHTYTAGGRIL